MTKPILRSTEAQLLVADIPTACDFYTGKLGFAVALIYGDPPFYAQVFRDRAYLNLKQVHGQVFAGDIREREQLLSSTITLATAEDIQQLYAAFSGAGVPMQQTLQTQPWGALNFVVRDPDNNLLLFAGPAA